MRIRLSDEASTDLYSALKFIQLRNPAAAKRVAARILAVIESLARGDFEGPLNQLSTGERVRSWPVRPFRIYYQRDSDELRVLRLLHQARHPILR